MRAEADSAIGMLRVTLRENPQHFMRRQRLAWALLLAGDTTRALAEADTGLALRSLASDAVAGVLNARTYAQTAAMAGDARRAVPVLRELLTKHSPITVAWLENDPIYDRIRNDSAFKALVARP